MPASGGRGPPGDRGEPAGGERSAARARGSFEPRGGHRAGLAARAGSRCLSILRPAAFRFRGDGSGVRSHRGSGSNHSGRADRGRAQFRGRARAVARRLARTGVDGHGERHRRGWATSRRPGRRFGGPSPIYLECHAKRAEHGPIWPDPGRIWPWKSDSPTNPAGKHPFVGELVVPKTSKTPQIGPIAARKLADKRIHLGRSG